MNGKTKNKNYKNDTVCWAYGFYSILNKWYIFDIWYTFYHTMGRTSHSVSLPLKYTSAEEFGCKVSFKDTCSSLIYSMKSFFFSYLQLFLTELQLCSGTSWSFSQSRVSHRIWTTRGSRTLLDRDARQGHAIPQCNCCKYDLGKPGHIH